MIFVLYVILFFSFFTVVSAAEADLQTIYSLLAPLLTAPTLNLSGAGSFPWQSTFVSTISTKSFVFESFLLSEIPGLITQCRHALHQNVKDIRVTIRKIAGLDVTWRAFLCADTDLNPEDFDTRSLVDFIRNHPGAIPKHTLNNDTTQSSIEFDLTWLIGLCTAVSFTFPPLLVPRIVIFGETTSTTSLADRELCITVSGTVDIAGYGYVAGHVSGAAAATT